PPHSLGTTLIAVRRLLVVPLLPPTPPATDPPPRMPPIEVGERTAHHHALRQPISMVGGLGMVGVCTLPPGAGDPHPRRPRAASSWRDHRPSPSGDSALFWPGLHPFLLSAEPRPTTTWGRAGTGLWAAAPAAAPPPTAGRDQDCPRRTSFSTVWISATLNVFGSPLRGGRG